MPSNITKAFKRKSALRGLVDGGRATRYPENAPIPPPAPPAPPNALGLGADATANFNANVKALGTEEGRTAFNDRNIATNTGLRASWDAANNVPLLTGAPSNIDASRGLGAVGDSGGGTVSFVPAGGMIASAQGAVNNALLDNMRSSLRTGDLGAFDINNARLGANLAGPGALSGGVLPGTPAPVLPAAAAPAAAPAAKPAPAPAPALAPLTGDPAFDAPSPMTPNEFAGIEPPRVFGPPSNLLTTFTNAVNPINPDGTRRTSSSARGNRGGAANGMSDSLWLNKADGGRIHPRGLADGGKPAVQHYNPLALNTRPQPTPEQEQRNLHTAGNVLMDLVPGSGIADALGYMPDLKGGTRPSMKANIQSGQYGPAAMQGLSAGGDAFLIGGTGLRLAKNAIKYAPDLIRAGMVGNLGEAGAGAIVNYNADYGMRSGGRIHPRGLRADNSGRVEGPGGPTDDKAGLFALSDDEYVLPADTAQAIGYENLDAIKDATHTPVKSKGKAKGLRDGGAIMIDAQGRPVGQQSMGTSLVPRQAPGVPITYPNGTRALVPVPQVSVAGGGAVPPSPPPAGGTPRAFTAGYDPKAAVPAAPSKGLGFWGRAGLAGTAVAEGMRGMGDYNTLTEAGETGHGPQVAFESASRVGGAIAGAKAGAMLPIPHPVLRGLAAAGGGLAGYAAPNLIADMTGHETARERADAFRDERASEMNLNKPAEQAPPQTQQGLRAPSQMMYADGTPYLADPGRVHMRPDMGGNNQIPSGARDINQRFDALAAEIQKKHGQRVSTPFGTRTLDRTNRLLELEQARAQALASNTNAMVNQRGQDMSAREAGLRAAGAGGGKGDSDADMLKELRLAQEKDMERQEKIAEQLWTEAERASGDNENMPTEQLYRFMTQSQGFMNQYMGASPAERKSMIAQMRDGYAEYAARQKRGLRLDTAVEPGLTAPVGMRRGASWDDVNKDRATWGDFLLGNLTGRQMVDYGNQLVPLKDIHKMNPERKGQINADILRRIGVTE
jgi:hypothetical protein